MEQDDCPSLTGDGKETDEISNNCNNGKDVQLSSYRLAANPPRTRSSKTSRKVIKKHIQGTSLNQMQSSLKATATIKNRDRYPEIHRLVQKSHSSPYNGAPLKKRTVEQSLSDNVERVATTTSIESSRENYPYHQPKTPIRTQSPTPLMEVAGRPPRSPTSQDSGADSDISGNASHLQGNRPRRKSMSTLSPRSEEQSIVTISQASQRHRARRRYSLSSSSEDDFPSQDSQEVLGGMLPATRPQRRRSISTSKDEETVAHSKSIGMDGLVIQTEGTNIRRRKNASKTRVARRHSLSSHRVTPQDSSTSPPVDMKGASARMEVLHGSEKENPSSRWDSGSLHESPPKPKASRSLCTAKVIFEKSSKEDEIKQSSPLDPKNSTRTAPETCLAQQRPSRERRFSLPRITRSLSLSLRPTSHDENVDKGPKNRSRSRSPSITCLFRKSGDLSTRSSTERTASTVSTELSNSSWDDSPLPQSPLSKSNDKGAFGKILSHLRMELQDNCSLDSPIPNRNDRQARACSGRRPRETDFMEAHQATMSDRREEKDTSQDVSTTLPEKVQSGTNGQVCFGTVSIREYARSVSDNPSVGAGTPIGLDWAYGELTIVPVDYYEKTFRKIGPRTRKDFYLTPEQRFHMLLDDWSFSMEEINDAKRTAAHVKYLRQMSLSGSISTVEALSKLLPFDRRTPSRERHSLKNYHLPRSPRAQSDRAMTPLETSLDL
jgi:hypothetical protein